jgi:hypothetical protein
MPLGWTHKKDRRPPLVRQFNVARIREISPIVIESETKECQTKLQNVYLELTFKPAWIRPKVTTEAQTDFDLVKWPKVEMAWEKYKALKKKIKQEPRNPRFSSLSSDNSQLTAHYKESVL